MSKFTIVVLLGGVVLFAVWMRSGDEPQASPHSSIESAESLAVTRPSLPERQRPRSSFDRPQVARDSAEPVQPEPAVIAPEPEIAMDTEVERPRRPKQPAPGLQARVEAFRARVESQKKLAGVARQEQLSRRETDDEVTNKVEQPPLRAPQMTDGEEDYEDTVDHWRDVALADPDPDERADALSELDLDDPAALDVVMAALDDSEPDVRLAALNELWLHSDDMPTGVLSRLLYDPDPDIRMEVVGMLAESEEPHARQLLRGALNDSDEDVRDEVRAALELD